MNILDIHTHRLPAEPGQAIQNCQPAEFIPLVGAYYSVGIHPWYLTRENFIHQWELLLSAIHSPQVLAIGEAGLDKLAQTDYVLQQEAFERQAILAHEMEYPLVIHAVRSADEIIRFKRKMQPSNPWIIHGFRGKKNWLCNISGREFIFHWERSIRRKRFDRYLRNTCFWRQMKV